MQLPPSTTVTEWATGRKFQKRRNVKCPNAGKSWANLAQDLARYTYVTDVVSGQVARVGVWLEGLKAGPRTRTAPAGVLRKGRAEDGAGSKGNPEKLKSEQVQDLYANGNNLLLGEGGENCRSSVLE